MARAVDETRKTLMAVSTFCDTMILIKLLSMKKVNPLGYNDKSKQSLTSKYMFYIIKNS